MYAKSIRRTMEHTIREELVIDADVPVARPNRRQGRGEIALYGQWRTTISHAATARVGPNRMLQTPLRFVPDRGARPITQNQEHIETPTCGMDVKRNFALMKR